MYYFNKNGNIIVLLLIYYYYCIICPQIIVLYLRTAYWGWSFLIMHYLFEGE